MRILIADDDPVMLATLGATLEMFGHDVQSVTTGLEALEILEDPESPRLAILDWTMPGLNGTDVCRRIRLMDYPLPPYLIILTARDTPADVLEALESGADEFLAKPVSPMELRARVRVGERMITLQQRLHDHNLQLRQALEQVKALHGILPICAYCKKIRNDQQYWQQVEHYIADHTGAIFSHGICPECWERHVVPEMEQLQKEDEV